MLGDARELNICSLFYKKARYSAPSVFVHLYTHAFQCAYVVDHRPHI